ncbi:N(6)-adenine-specific methyltransferase METTL4-like [Uloborus diversus]|uniref:N(6)-adenine-specific methyltransferase METTL4-like n=1 Tax=Uloborus diversus TaxID=327109 RepID=UPI00240999DE|nr:N(6)-adenine-specific methyltransferase METTL4-like [Uloborus diversus]
MVTGKVNTNKSKKRKKGYFAELQQVDSIVNKATLFIVEAAKSLNHLDETEITPFEWLENNSNAVIAGKEALESSVSSSSILKYENVNDTAVIKSTENEQYVLPAHSTFYLCDIKELHLRDKCFDLIVLDPPWENKSVRRKRGYSVMPCDALQHLSLNEICNENCLIVVWVTNNKKQIAFVQNELFPKWHVSFHVIWHWSKITQKGQSIHPIESHHKKPYENILIGRVNDGASSTVAFKELENHKVIVSVPSSIHSQKPPLIEILQPYTPENPKCLELFARYLLPGWTSVGNEVVKLQNLRLFHKEKEIL